MISFLLCFASIIVVCCEIIFELCDLGLRYELSILSNAAPKGGAAHAPHLSYQLLFCFELPLYG